MQTYLGPWSHQDLSVTEFVVGEEQGEGPGLGENARKSFDSGELGRRNFGNLLALLIAEPQRVSLHGDVGLPGASDLRIS